MKLPRIAVGPVQPRFVSAAITEGGGDPADATRPADGLVWMDFRDVEGLRSALAVTGARWVQLPMAGVEAVAAAGLFRSGPVWTSAKGVYARPVAEHALALALAGLRQLPTRLAARRWGSEGGAPLYDSEVTILGGGGITEELLRMLGPFGTRNTVVRRRPGAMAGADRVVGLDRLDEVLVGARVVWLALALTDETRGIIDSGRLAAMEADAWLVNVARGGHVVTADLLAALDAGAIGGAALDVTDPEPLPDGHPLFGRSDCIVTPHTADTQAMVRPLLAQRIATNVSRFAAGRELVGTVDADAGY